MTFRIGSGVSGLTMAAALVGFTYGCSTRASDPPAGAAPAESAARPDSATAVPVTQASHAEPAPAEAPTAAPADTQYLNYDAATKTVTFKLVAGPFAFNGFTNGGGTLTVPPGTTNVWNFVQDDGTPHSAEVASGTGPIPNSGGDPAIPRAYTNKVVEGMAQGATDVIRFTAPDTGSYRIICGVPGHALSGMWVWFKVDPTAKAPTFGATPK
jgi:plastocyanin